MGDLAGRGRPKLTPVARAPHHFPSQPRHTPQAPGAEPDGGNNLGSELRRRGHVMRVMDDDGFVPDAPPTLSAETCDHCGPAVKAYLFVLVNGTELAYCGSCGTRYFDNLVKVGSVIVDMRHAIHS